MSNEEELDEYLGDADVIISELAQQMISLKFDLNNGDISQDEFDELVGDVMDLEQIHELVDNIERKANVEKAAKAIAKIVGMIL